MNHIRAYDDKGQALTSLTQWDANRCFYIKNYNFETIPDCHYETNRLNEALIVRGELTEGEKCIKFNIPNILLCHNDKITAYIYQSGSIEEPTESKTIYVVSFEILKRIKPADYIYTATEAFSYSQLSKKVDDLIKDIETIKSSSGGIGDAQFRFEIIDENLYLIFDNISDESEDNSDNKPTENVTDNPNNNTDDDLDDII